MSDSRQLIFDWPHRPAIGRDDYLVSDCNREAVDWIDLWPDWPLPVLVLCGPSGSGKSHLAAVWRACSGGIALDPADLPDMTTIGSTDPCHHVLENAGTVTDHTALLHLYNQTVEMNGSLLLTDERPAADWNISLPDLRSRLLAAPMVEIGMPDDSLIEAVLVKMFLDRQLDIEPGVVAYLVLRMERSFGFARYLVSQLDEAALAQHRTITIPLAREVIRRISSNNFPDD